MEARSTDKFFVPSKENIEIVQWDKDRCWVIAFFEKRGVEGHWDLIFVGMRPLHENVDWQDFKLLIQEGYAFLDKQE